MWMLKTFGCLLVILSCGAVGMKLAVRLKKRVKTLIETEFAIDAVAVYIRMSNSEIDTVLSRTLPSGMTFDGQGLIADNSLCLNDSDRELLTAFLKDIGMSDADTLLKRCASYKELIVAQRKKAQQDVEERYRLFLICGWLTGIILSLLWW